MNNNKTKPAFSLSDQQLLVLSTREKIIHFLFPLVFIFAFWFLYTNKYLETFEDYLRVAGYSMIYVLLAWINMHFLFQRYFIHGSYLLYFSLNVIIIFIGYIGEQLLMEGFSIKELINDIQDKRNLYIIDFFINILTVFMLTSVGLAFMIFHLFMKTKRLYVEVENNKLKAELDNLKFQINPHFLFNTLNNLHVLIKKDPDKASEAILHLADISRYQIYETSKEKAKLKDELKYIDDVLELERLRKDNIQIVKEYKIYDQNLLIEPMIFTPLVENAIKHGSQKLTKPFINIYLESDEETLNFTIKNNFNASNENSNEQNGLKNLRNRLQIVYPTKHELSFNSTNDTFEAKLKIKLR